MNKHTSIPSLLMGIFLQLAVSHNSTAENVSYTGKSETAEVTTGSESSDSNSVMNHEKWRFGGALLYSHHDYNEQIGNIKVSSQTLELGMYAQKYYGNGAFDFSGSVQFSLFNLGSTATSVAGDLPGPIYGKAEVILNYLPSSDFLGENSQMKLGLGLHAWGMGVERELYGVNFVSGPLVSAEIGSSSNSKRLWVMNLKLAPLSEKAFTLEMTSYKVSIGASYGLVTLFESQPVDLLFEVEKMSLDLESATNDVEILSFNLGLKYGF